MNSYKVLAQAEVGTHQITKTVQAMNEAAVLRMISPELFNASYYIVSIKKI